MSAARISNTGDPECRTTRSAALPSTHLPTPERPWVVMATRLPGVSLAMHQALFPLFYTLLLQALCNVLNVFYCRIIHLFGEVLVLTNRILHVPVVI